MAKPPPIVEASSQLGDLDPSHQLKDGVPPPIHDRAEDLMEILVAEARKRGLRSISRGDLVASLIHHAPKDGPQLVDKILLYWHSQVWETLDAAQRTGPITLRERKPGRTRR